MNSYRKLILILILIPGISFCQQVDQEVYLFDKNTNPGAILTEIPRAKPRLEGSFYLDDHWKIADLVLNNGRKIPRVEFRYDMLNEIFELKSEGINKNLSIVHFKQITVYNGLSSKVTEYETLHTHGMTNEEGIIRMVYEDDVIAIAQKPFVEVKAPTYVPTHHAGNPNMKIIKKSIYYLIEDKKFYPFKSTVSSLSGIGNRDSKSIKGFIKERKLNLKNEDHLVEVIKYLTK